METEKAAMRGHLSDEALMDALDGAAGGPAAAHLASCTECAARLDEARQGLDLSRAATVPDPAEPYWEAFPRQVAHRIGASASRRAWWRPWLVPGLATAAAAVLAVAFLARPWSGPGTSSGSVASRMDRPSAAPLPAWSPLPASEDDPGLPVLQALGPELVPAVECDGVADCLADLSDDESRDLVRALRPGVKESLL